MIDIASVISAGTANPWIYLPAAILLGAAHGLEPGHAKSMMAAFIVAIRGSKAQAVLLGVSAAVSHSLVVAVLAMLGLWLGDGLIGDTAMPYLHIIGGGIVVAMALWMLVQVMGLDRAARAHSHDGHAYGCGCGHGHDGAAEARRMAADGKVGNWQIMLFGLTGGLLPCPASIAVLLICIQLREFSLGAAMVGAFSLGLALTLVGVGVAAAWGRGKVEALYGQGRAEKLAKILPMGSSVLMLLLGGIMLASGLMHII
jgi:nickel/cobalt exporter